MFLRKHAVPISVLFLIVLYFFTRFFHILTIPIFTDEAIYIRWAQIAKQDANWRFISLTDGKQPMFIWVLMVVLKFIKDPLLAGRFVSVLAGIATTAGLYFLGAEAFKNKWVGFLSAFFYVIYPFGIVYDRMALYDSMVGAFAVWSLYLEILLVRNVKTNLAYLSALVIGGALLTKTNAFFDLYLLPFSLILFDWKSKERMQKLIKWSGLAILVAGLSYLYYSILRLSPFFHIIDEKNTIFVYPFREWLSHPLTYFVSNWKGLFNWLLLYMTFPMLILLIASFFLNKKYLKEKILLFIWFFAPFLFLALFGKTIYPRFILFMTLPLIPIIVDSAIHLSTKLKSRSAVVLLGIVLLAMPLWADYKIYTDFGHAPIPRSDKDQYSNDWPAGGGVKESVDFFNKEAEKGKIYIATEGTFGLLPYALEIYLVENPNIKIVGYWPMNEDVFQNLIKISKEQPTYFVFYQPCPNCSGFNLAPTTWKMKTVLSYPKQNPRRFYTVYQVNK